MTYYKSESTINPDTVDTTSSKTSVYLRRNITEKEREIDGHTLVYYEYEEAKLTKDEYKKYVNELNSENIRAAIQELKTKVNSINDISEQIELLTECILEISQSIYK